MIRLSLPFPSRLSPRSTRENRGIPDIGNEIGKLYEVYEASSEDLEDLKGRYLQSIEDGLGKMLWYHLLYKNECKRVHEKWDEAFNDLVPVGHLMSSEQMKFRVVDLEGIKKQHLEEIDNIWREPIREWSDRYERIAGKLPDVKSTDWDRNFYSYRPNDNFNAYLKKLIGK